LPHLWFTQQLVEAFDLRGDLALCGPRRRLAGRGPEPLRPFGPLRTFAIGNSNHPNHTMLARKLQAYLRWRNANHRHPDILAAQRRERAQARSQKGIRFGGRPLTTAA
jgi:hypothetical protein